MPLRRLRTTTPSMGTLSESVLPSCMGSSVKAHQGELDSTAAPAKRKAASRPHSFVIAGTPEWPACGLDPRSRSVPGLVDQLVLLDPGHHRAQLLADDLDRALRVQA